MKLIETNITEAKIGNNKLQELQLIKLKAQTKKIIAEIRLNEVKAKTHKYLLLVLSGLALIFSLGDFID